MGRICGSGSSRLATRPGVATRLLRKRKFLPRNQAHRPDGARSAELSAAWTASACSREEAPTRKQPGVTRVSPFSKPALGGLGGSGARSPQSEVERSSTGNHSDSPMPTFQKHGKQRKGESDAHAAHDSAELPAYDRGADRALPAAPSPGAARRRPAPYSERASSRERPPAAPSFQGRVLRPRPGTTGNYSSPATARASSACSTASTGVSTSMSRCLYAPSPVPAGMRRPMMTFSLSPRS